MVVDGHSTDGTVEFLRAKGIQVYSQQKLGRVNALIEAMEHVHGDAIVFLSGDGNEDPRDIRQLLNLIEDNDMVLASRFAKGGRSDDSDDPLRFRRVMSIILAKLVNLVWRVNLTDVTNGLRAIRRSVWQDGKIGEGYHSAELQLVIHAAKRRKRIAEIPTVEGRRVGQRRNASTIRMANSLLAVLLAELSSPEGTPHVQTFRGRQPVIMLLAKAYRMDGRSSSPRARQEAESLLEAGYSVHVIAWDRYGEFPAMENVDGITVRSVSSVNLASNLAGFSRIGLALGGLIFNALLVVESVKMIRQLKQRPIVHAHDINTLVIGCLLRRLRLCSGLVYDCREFTYGAYYEWFSLAVASVVGAIEQRCLPCADAVITVADPIASHLLRFNPATEIIYNCPRSSDIPSLSKQEARIRLGLPLEDFIISYIGAIRRDSRLDLLLAVARLIKKDNIHFVVVGDGPLASEFRRAAREGACAHLTVLPRVPRETALSYLLASDLTWAVYQNRIESLNPRWALPWKFFESLACGVPVVAEGGTVRAKLINELKCGLVLESDDPSDVSRAILWVAAHSDQHLKMCADAKNASASMRWETMSAKLIGVYSRLPSVRPPVLVSRGTVKPRIS